MNTVQRSTRTLATLGLALALTGLTATPALASGSTASESTASGSTASGDGPAAAGDVTPYQPSGTEVTGGNSLSGAVEVDPGRYRDVLATSEDGSGEGSTRFYRLPALAEGERAHVAAVLATDRDSARESAWAELSVEFLNQQGRSCSTPGREALNIDSGQVPVAATSTAENEPESFGCFEDGSGVVVAQVTRAGTWQADDPVPVELWFWIEPPVDESGLAPAPDADLPPESVTVTGQAEPITGGTSFTSATAVEPDRVYSLEIDPVEAAYFRVPVEYGQRLSYRLSTGNNQQSRVREVTTRMYTPLLDLPRAVGSQSLRYGDNGGTLTRSTAVTVSRDNYDSHSYGPLRHAGDYYIVVEGSEARTGREGTEPFRLDLAVAVSGDADGTTEWLADPQQGPSDAGGPEGDGADGQAAAGAAGPGGSSGGGWPPSATELGALLGGVGLGAVLTGVAWLLLRRRRSA